jgi:hypothetical protein|tara:strand:- start:1751 stop:2083 length:333 start_codon:yes stop_codon:yes gene_type:complete
MNIDIQKENNVLIINVVLIPYRDKRRVPLIKREIFNSKIAKEAICNAGYDEFISDDFYIMSLDNKFTNPRATFKISKPHASSGSHNNFKLDKQSSPVVKSNRKKPLTTDE